MGTAWETAQEWERRWHGNCANSYHEETKQLAYAARMGLVAIANPAQYPVYDLRGRSVLDIGGGPCSMLLKCMNVKGTVLDPCAFPDWVAARYQSAGIRFVQARAEDWQPDQVFDEAWLYNCLQHTDDPAKVVANALAWAKVLRVYEWIETGTGEGHLHSFAAEYYDAAFGAAGFVETVANGSKAWYGMFAGRAGA